MGLLSIIRKQKLKDREIRVLMLGLDNLGKLSLLSRMLGRLIELVAPTMGFGIELVEVEPFVLNVWDIGGQGTLRPFWFNYFDQTDALVWVVDAASLEARLSEMALEFAGVLQQDTMIAGCGFLVVVNKVDLVGAEAAERCRARVTEVLGLERLTTHKWTVVATSAKTGQGVEEGLRWMVDEVTERLYGKVG